MGRLCGGAHETSGIKAPLFSPWWGGVGVVGWGWCSGGGCGGGLGGDLGCMVC